LIAPSSSWNLAAIASSHFLQIRIYNLDVIFRAPVFLSIDSLGALALATELPTEELLKFKPYDRSEPLITVFMLRRMMMLVVVQTTTFLLLLYSGSWSWIGGGHGVYTTQHLTMVFNGFVLSQMINQFNSRKLRGEWNVFAGIERHWIFVAVWVVALTVQVLFVEFGGSTLEVEALSAEQWAVCVGLALLPFLWALLFSLLPDWITKDEWWWWNKLVAGWVVLMVRMKICGRLRQKAEQEVVVGREADGVSTVVPGEVSPSLSPPPQPINTADATMALTISRQPSEQEVINVARERWHRILWQTITEVQVVDAFRRKRR